MMADKKYVRLTPEQLAAQAASILEWWDNLSPEQKRKGMQSTEWLVSDEEIAIND